MNEGAVPTTRLSSLLHVGRLAQTEVNLELLRQEILEVVAEAMNAERATLYFVDDERQILWSRVFTKAEVPEIRVEIGQGIAGQVAATGEIINVPDVEQDHRFDPSMDQRTGYKTRSLLAVPLKNRQGLILGVLQVLNRDPSTLPATDNGRHEAFSTADENLLVLLAMQVSMILSNSSLGRRLLRPASRLRSNKRGRDTERFNRIVGGGARMMEVYDRIEQVARTSVTVLVCGESGTGKELVSRAVHVNSPRRDRPFVKVDCAALPETLLENELFGHAKGAFTGAEQPFPGKLAQAEDGTLFLDEIGELPLAVQGKLLRVLQDREYEPLGSQSTLPVRARIVTATNRDLEEMVRKGRFRKDLYYRIRVAVLNLPPLRERGEEDLRELIGYFLERLAGRHDKMIRELSKDAEAALLRYSWPGNVRELENCLESAIVFAKGTVLKLEHLPLPGFLKNPSPKVTSSPSLGSPFDQDLTLEELERLYIEHMLTRVQGNKSEAARRLGIGRNTLSRKIKHYALES